MREILLINYKNLQDIFGRRRNTIGTKLILAANVKLVHLKTLRPSYKNRVFDNSHFLLVLFKRYDISDQGRTYRLDPGEVGEKEATNLHLRVPLLGHCLHRWRGRHPFHRPCQPETKQIKILH